jgi:hypothetical protein
MKELTPDKFREGMKVTCRIENIDIKDAKLHFEDSYWYLCQNEKAGCSLCKNKLGYKYSWKISIKHCEFDNYYLKLKIKSAISLKERIKILKKELAR